MNDRPSPWLIRVWLPLARVIAWLLFLVFGPLSVRGRYRVPKSGGILILSNHLADIDPIAVQYASPRHVHFMAKSELFEMRGLRWLLKVWRSFPIKRGEPDREAIRRAVDLLRSGEAVCIFPEGQLSETGELQELKAGVALIIRMARCEVICCGLENTNRVMPYGTLIPRPAFRRVRANWGEPRNFDKATAPEEVLGWIRAQLLEPDAGTTSGRLRLL